MLRFDIIAGHEAPPTYKQSEKNRQANQKKTGKQMKEKLDKAWAEGPDHYIRALTDHYWDVVGGELTAETMDRLNADQHTLLAYRILMDEVSEGGFIQLIQNGYGQYVLGGPFPMVMKKIWGFPEFHNKHTVGGCAEDLFVHIVAIVGNVEETIKTHTINFGIVLIGI